MASTTTDPRTDRMQDEPPSGRQPREAGTLGAAARSERQPLARLGSLTGVRILGTGCYVPDRIVRNEDLRELGYDADWIVQRTGILERRRAAPEQATSDLAVEASRQCLEQAGLHPDELDLILLATMTPDMPAPSTACALQHRLGATAPAIDINAACAGFIYALVTGMQFVKTGCCRHVLVVGSDVMTRIVDPEDRKTFPLFGDGAGAVVLGRGSREQGFLSFTLGADGSGNDFLCMPTGGSREPITHAALDARRQYVQMDGRSVFKWAVRTVQESIRDVLERASTTVDQIDLFVLHQANIRIIDALVADLAIPRDRVLVNLDRYGNTSAASIPLVLGEGQRAGRIGRGGRILVAGFGAGLAWGAGVLEW
ncbi:MAG: ketoacyl-ACP synthase III [Planctomycetes bacterium]|nr:ketoacyl-ACP synthase III [Planctomycetota bacterium]